MEKMNYESLLRRLGRENIRFVVAGGMAVVLHGVLRMTLDLDLIVDLEPGNLDVFLDVMEDLGYRPRVPLDPQMLKDEKMRREWKEERGMLVFTFIHPQHHLAAVDLFVEEPLPFDELIRDSVRMEAGDMILPIISVGHLIRLKEIAGRPQDLRDIEALRALNSGEKPS